MNQHDIQRIMAAWNPDQGDLTLAVFHLHEILASVMEVRLLLEQDHGQLPEAYIHPFEDLREHLQAAFAALEPTVAWSERLAHAILSVRQQ